MKTQRINVFFDSAKQQVSVDKEVITLTDSIGRVIWKFHGLPKGASPAIGFEEDRGPFVALESSVREVVGKGNIGPGTSDLFLYQIEVRTLVGTACTATGMVINAATTGTVSLPLQTGPAHCEWPATCA